MMNLKLPAALLATLFLASPLFAASPAPGPDARARLLLDADALAARLDTPDQVILHVGDPAVYAAGHVPGARLLPQGYFTRPRGNDPTTLLLELPDPRALQAQLQQLGIGRESRIVVVHGKPEEFAAATRTVHTLDAAGWGDRVQLLDGGLAEWQRRGHPLSTETPEIKRTALTPPKMHPHAVDMVFLKDHPPGKDYVLLDARLPAFYSGAERSRYPSGEAPAGHLPGARNLPFSSVLDDSGKLRPQDELRALFREAGVVPGKKVVTYCHIGQQASALLFAARLIGLDAALYDGSFQEWTQHGLPVETAGGATAR